MSIWSNLRKAKTADALASQRDNLAGVIGSHEAELARLRETLRSGAFDDPSFDPKALGAQIRESEDELAALKGAMEGVDRELAAARERERQAALESRAAEGAKLRKQLLADYRELHKLLTRVTELTAGIRTGRRDLQGLNTELRAAGRPDLTTRHPLDDLGALLAPAPKVGEPQWPWRGVLDPTGDELRIPGYLPAIHYPDQRDLQHLDKVA
jgi:hypothetical protein